MVSVMFVFKCWLLSRVQNGFFKRISLRPKKSFRHPKLQVGVFRCFPSLGKPYFQNEVKKGEVFYHNFNALSCSEWTLVYGDGVEKKSLSVRI